MRFDVELTALSPFAIFAGASLGEPSRDLALHTRIELARGGRVRSNAGVEADEGDRARRR
jgi:hypothetical protein